MLQQKKIAGMLGAMTLALSALSASSEKPNGCTGPVLCPSFPIATRCGDCCYTWHVSVGALYEQPGFANMSPGLAYNPVFQDPTTVDWDHWINRSVEPLQATYDYSPGLAVELGHQTKHDGWFFGLTFDWLHGSINNRVYNDRNLLYRPSSEFDYSAVFYSNFDYPRAGFTKVVYKANTNIYNLGILLSRGAYLSNRFSLEPFGGIKGLWFDNSQLKKYQQPTQNADKLSRYSINNYQENWGVGPMVGLNLKYTITSGLSLFSNNSVGALYGEMNYNITTTVTGGTNLTFAVDPRISKNYGNNIVAMYVPVRNTIGIELSRYFNDLDQFVALRIGYDAQCVLSPSNTSVLQVAFEPDDPFGGPDENVTLFGRVVPVMNNLNNGYFMSGLKIDVILDF